jgi:hypothetical protein
MIIVCCGDRNWTDEDEIRKFLKCLLVEFPANGITLVHGNCRGADVIAGKIGHELGFTVIPVDAKWNEYRKAAGPIRNRLMIKKYNPDIVVGFHNDYERSKGTKDMLTRAKKANIYTILITSDKVITIHSKKFKKEEMMVQRTLC